MPGRTHSRLALAAAVVLLLVVTAAAHAGRRGMTISVDADGPIEDCDQIHIRFSDSDRDAELETVRADQTLSIPNAERLTIHTTRNGHVRVQDGEGADYSVLACKAASSVSRDTAERILERVSVTAEGGRLTVDGPSGNDWLVYLVIRAPRGAKVDVATQNGPISAYRFSGELVARSTNGPISIEECSGNVQIDTQNGPISSSGSAGDLRLTTQNGPIAVQLTGDSWKGSGLEARTQNGPISLKLPEDYRSGVRVEASGHSPMNCSRCDTAHKTWDDDRRLIEFGEGDPIVRMTTNNGPVSVEPERSRGRHGSSLR